MGDVRQPARIEIEQLRREVRDLAAAVARLSNSRPPNPVHPRDIRWAVTKKKDGLYPTTSANTFPIRFVDAHFTAAAGQQTFSSANRQADTDERWTYAHTATGNWIPQDVPIPVFRQRGLGDDEAGEWWILDPPKAYFGKARGPLTSGGSVAVEIWIYSGGWKKTDCVVGALDWFLKTGTIPIWTRLRIEWYLSTWVVTNAACSADLPPGASGATGYGSGADPLAGGYQPDLYSPELFSASFAPASTSYLDR